MLHSNEEHGEECEECEVECEEHEEEWEEHEEEHEECEEEHEEGCEEHEEEHEEHIITLHYPAFMLLPPTCSLILDDKPVCLLVYPMLVQGVDTTLCLKVGWAW